MICCALAVLGAMLVFPLVGLKSGGTEAAQVIKLFKSEMPTGRKDTFRIYDASTDKVTVMSAEDYIFGVVAAEMPLLYGDEALKAQAVAAYTLACRKRTDNAEGNYDLTTDSNTDQAFVTETEARARWGEKAEEYVKKLREIIHEVSGITVTYEDEPITAVYHAISSGQTENSADIWGGECPYLQAAASPGDLLAPDYISRVTLSTAELCERLKSVCEFTGEPENYFSDFKRSGSGSVLSLKLCGQAVTGAEVRAALELRSLNFEVEFNGGSFVFTVRGYGHGVGMSQYGARCMAEQGCDFKEILLHYYVGCKINMPDEKSSGKGLSKA